MGDWDPELYNRFRRYRAEPFEMILARLKLQANERIVDLGCGTGENTVELARRSADGRVIGIDSSRAMIDQALKLRSSLEPDLRERVNFELGDIAQFDADRAFTVVFSNAALQWVSDHHAVLAACRRALGPGGTLVIQMPANDGETAQMTIHALAAEREWRAEVGGVETPSRRAVGAPNEYSAMLVDLGFVEVDCHYHTFSHPMTSPAEVVEWSSSTTLRPYFDKLTSARQNLFVEQLNERLEASYGTRGPLTFEFRRLFIWARAPVQ